MAMIRFSRKLDKRLQKIVQRVLQNNGYFAHSDAIQLTMLSGKPPAPRARAVNQILTICMKAEQGSQVLQPAEDDGRGVDEVDDGLHLDNMEKVRSYVIPRINFEASDYMDLTDWEATQLTELPLTSSLINE